MSKIINIKVTEKGWIALGKNKRVNLLNDLNKYGSIQLLKRINPFVPVWTGYLKKSMRTFLINANKFEVGTTTDYAVSASLFARDWSKRAYEITGTNIFINDNVYLKKFNNLFQNVTARRTL